MKMRNNLSSKNNSFTHTILFLIFTTLHSSSAQDKFSTNYAIELVTLSSAGFLISSAFLLENDQPISSGELNSLNKNDINFFDRSATQFYSKSLSTVSDVLLVSSLSLPVFLIFSNPSESDLKTIGLMYLETLSLTFGVTNLTKNLTQRFRPYAYNSNVPLTERQKPDARKSFFSGHTSMAFASAIFFINVFNELNSDKKIFVTAGSLSLASAVGLLRFFSGNHYPTDIIAAGIMGSIIGYAITEVHKTKENPSILLNTTPNLISMKIYLR